ncbi:ATP-binding protein [Mariprofundus micogutta]|uniref:ATP-binding protein n=1 Tax=Mariprofundus micogutta TaxID=1921010 RepID=UPI001D11801D|nr:ATP-binding protein [Mariprofundus micogutta]
MSFSEKESSHVGKLCLQLNCNSDCIHVLRSMVAVMTARAGMDELRSNRVAIAVDELFANIATHAYGGKAGRVEMETCICNESDRGPVLIFDFRDFASVVWSGDIKAAANHEPDPANLTPGGLGLRLICKVSDHCEHESLEDGNHWRLIFNINDGEQNGCNA